MSRRGAWAVALVALVTSAAHAGPTLVGLGPAEDARKVLAIGPAGELYAPERGDWVRTRRVTTATTLGRVGRAGDAIVAHGEGVVYRLADNGWSALRLAQDGKALMSAGDQAVGAVGRQLYSLHQLQRGEPAKLGVAPGSIRAIGAGKTIVLATDKGVFRVEGGKATKLAKAPKQVDALVGDRWAIVDRGVVELRTGKLVAWPAGTRLHVVARSATGDLVAVAAIGGALELYALRGAAFERTPIPGARGTAVGVVVDRAGRALVALEDGTLHLREGTSWKAAAVRDALPAARPGPAPATSR